MKPRVKRILILVAGWSFILLGIAGLFLPFLQGVSFSFLSDSSSSLRDTHGPGIC